MPAILILCDVKSRFSLVLSHRWGLSVLNASVSRYIALFDQPIKKKIRGFEDFITEKKNEEEKV